MRVVLTNLWENERRVSSLVRSLSMAICQAHKLSETHLESVTENGDRSFVKVSYHPVCGEWGAAHAAEVDVTV